MPLFFAPVASLVKFHVALVTESSDSIIICFDRLAFAVPQLVRVGWDDVVSVSLAMAAKAKGCIVNVVEKFSVAPSHVSGFM